MTKREGISAPRKEQALQILYQALAQPLGLLLRTPTPQQSKQLLLQAKYSAKDPALAELQVRTSPFEGGELVVVNRRVQIRRTEGKGAKEN